MSNNRYSQTNQDLTLDKESLNNVFDSLSPGDKEELTVLSKDIKHDAAMLPRTTHPLRYFGRNALLELLFKLKLFEESKATSNPGDLRDRDVVGEIKNG